MTSTTKIEDLGWCQGSILPVAFIEKLKSTSESLKDIQEDSALIVLTQDCDMVSPFFEEEPYVEVLLAKRLPTNNFDGNYTERKNPRRLHFPIEMTEKIWHEASIHQKHKLSRKDFEEFAPSSDAKLDKATVGLVIDWVASRYVRSSFPHEFNERCKDSVKEIKKIFKAEGKAIKAVFLMLHDYSELADGVDYRVFMRLTVSVEDWEDIPKRTKLLEIMNKVEIALKKSAGIDICDCQLNSEAHFTLDDVKRYRRWDYDYLSYRDAPQDGAASLTIVT